MLRQQDSSDSALESVEHMYKRKLEALRIHEPDDASHETMDKTNASTPAVTSNPATRTAFLALGKVKREGEQAPPAQQLQRIGSVVVVRPKNRWMAPPSAPQMAQHQLEDSQLPHGIASLIDDDDDDPIDPKPTWNRGQSNHIEAIMYSNPAPQPLRYQGPKHRSGVPLPKEAKKGK
jgi:hypothetical protein